MTECAEVAVDIRDTLDRLGLELFPKTSGSKGLQLYLPLNTPPHPRPRQRVRPGRGPDDGEAPPDQVVSNMKKELRKGKVLIDWSQNSPPQDDDLRVLAAGPAPPDGVDAGHLGRGRGGGRRRAAVSSRPADVLDRVDEMGDLFARHRRAAAPGRAVARRRPCSP